MARLEQVVFACADPALHEQLVALLRQHHAKDMRIGRQAVMLPCEEGRSPALLAWNGMSVVAQPLPGEALVHGAEVPRGGREVSSTARTRAREAAREAAWIARASKPARKLRAELLARRAPYKASE